MSDRDKMKPWHSEITDVAPNSLTTRGFDQREIIRNFSYEEMVFLLIRGRTADDTEKNMLRAVLVSYISHGITGQSTLAVREAADCRSDFLHALIAGLSVGSGKYHLGALTAAMRELKRLANMSHRDVIENISMLLEKGQRITGFGHRFHDADPRAKTLLEIAGDSNFTGIHLDTARAIESFLQEKKGISINIEGAAAAVLLDLGFEPDIGYLFVVLGRSPMFAAAYLERLEQEMAPFQRIEVFDIVEDSD